MKKWFLLVVMAVAPLLAGEHTDFTVQKVEPFRYCAVEMTGSYMQHESAFQTLYTEAPAQGVDIQTQAPFGIYYSDMEMEAEEDLRWEVGLKLNADQEVKEPLVAKTWDFTQQVETVFSGPVAEMGSIFQELAEWAAGEGYTVGLPVMQVFEDAANSTPDNMKIKIIMPIVK